MRTLLDVSARGDLTSVQKVKKQAGSRSRSRILNGFNHVPTAQQGNKRQIDTEKKKLHFHLMITDRMEAEDRQPCLRTAGVVSMRRTRSRSKGLTPASHMFRMDRAQAGFGSSLSMSRGREKGWAQTEPLCHHTESGQVRDFKSDRQVADQYWVIFTRGEGGSTTAK